MERVIIQPSFVEGPTPAMTTVCDSVRATFVFVLQQVSLVACKGVASCGVLIAPAVALVLPTPACLPALFF